MKPDVLANETALASGHLSLRPGLAIGIPFLIATGAFVAFIVFALFQDGASFTVRVGGTRFPVLPWIGRLGFAPFVGVAIGTLLLLASAIVRQFGSRYKLTSRAFVLYQRGRRIVLPLADVANVRVENDMVGWRFVFIAQPAFEVTLDASACRRLLPALRDLGIELNADADVPRAYPGLALGEPVRWRQWQGPAAVGWPMWLGLFVLALPLLFFAWFGWDVVSRDILGGAVPLVIGFAKLVMTLMGGLILALGPTLLFFKLAPNAAADTLGTLAVTDRRIVWLGFRNSEVRREIAGIRLAEAVQLGPRWISLTVRDEEKPDNVFDLDLRGIRRPDRALAALGELIHSHGY